MIFCPSCHVLEGKMSVVVSTAWKSGTMAMIEAAVFRCRQYYSLPAYLCLLEQCCRSHHGAADHIYMQGLS